MSSETHPIQVTNLDSDKIRANEIAIENSKTGKVTAVVAVIYLFRDKLCNSRSAKRKPLAKDRQKSASKSEKSKRLARIRQNVALRDDLEKDRWKASRTGTSDSHDDISTSLKVETKTINRGTLPMAPSKPRRWATLNCPFWTTPPVKGSE
jgi:hypothetical protein